jgi:hypothetical protein
MAGAGYLTIAGFRGLLSVALVHAVALAPIVPVSDALATTPARQGEMIRGRFDCGWLRAGGSAAFISATFLSLRDCALLLRLAPFQRFAVIY